MNVKEPIGPASAGPIFDLIGRATQFATGSILVFLVILVCSEAFLRGAFNYSLGFAEELTGYCVVMLTFFGAALALRNGSLFRVYFLFDTMPENLKVFMKRLFICVALFICIVLAWKAKDLVISSFDRGKFAPTVLRTQLWIPQLFLPTGFVIIGIFLVEQFLLTLKKFKAYS